MIPFVKYHGLGNDFLVVDAAAWGERPIEHVIAACDRHQGVGGDGILLWAPAPAGESGWDVSMVIYNQDGSRPEMCGNGVRCVAALVAELGITAGDAVRVLSDAGVRTCRLLGHRDHAYDISVDMGRAMALGSSSCAAPGGYALSWIGISMGNPHAVVWEQPDLATIDRVGEWLNDAHPSWPQGVNVEFVRPSPDGGWDVIVYERGVGRTLACGTGACAVAAALWSTGRAPDGQPTTVYLPGGPLTIHEEGDALWMTGPAARTFAGIVDPDRMIAGRAR
jgi:diaminopimelate epimerase